MSDAAPSPTDFLGADADEELIFDEPSAVDAVSPVVSATDTAKPRRAPRRGRKSSGEDASPEPVPADTMPKTSAGAVAPTAEEPASPVPASFPPQGAEPAGSKIHPWLMATVGLALLTSTLSLGGLIAVGRTLAHTEVDRTQVAAERHALAGVPLLVAHLDAASVRLDATALRAAPASPTPATSQTAGPAITLADLHRELDGLKLSLGQRQPEGLSALTGVAHDGFSELGTKLDRLAAQLDQLERRGGAVSASRPATRASGPGRS